MQTNKLFRLIFIFCLFGFTALQVRAQDLSSISYSNPQEFEVGGITVTGTKFFNPSIVAQLSGLSVGKRITVPGDDVTNAIKKLWGHGLFSDVKLNATKVEDGKIYFELVVQERSRMSNLVIHGVRKLQEEDLREKLKIVRGTPVTDNLMVNAQNTVRNFYVDKGFLRADVRTEVVEDTSLQNSSVLHIYVTKNKRTKIKNIEIDGNSQFKDSRIRRAMKETKKKRWYGMFKPSKFIKNKYNEDHQKIIELYNNNGFRDAEIVGDSIWDIDEKTIGIKITINEGRKYYFGNISFTGNTVYSSAQLLKELGVKKGDVYSPNELDKRLSYDEDAMSNMYLDNGYLFYSGNPVETNVANDTIDIEIRIYEGAQATVNRVTNAGNTKTNDHVILREVRTMPGDLFSKSAIIRTVRELSQLGHFDPEKISPTPVPNPADATVDLNYQVEERANDQVEVSGGWGQGQVVGTVGVRFNNFSIGNFFNPKAWQPVPSGDGQSFSIRAQSNGRTYQAYSISFMEPWLGGKKPNSLSVSVYHNLISNGQKTTSASRRDMRMTGASVGLGRRLKWPDDYFMLYNELSFQNFLLNDWYEIAEITNGSSNTISFLTTFSRNSTDNPLYTRRGSSFSLSLRLTPPFSLMNPDYYAELRDKINTTPSNDDDYQQAKRDLYKWIEYHKWTFKASWFTPIWKDLVLNTKAEFGFLAYYNKNVGHSPFETFNVGGDGMTGYNLYGTDVVSLRGYTNGSIGNNTHLYNKFTMELRYPITLSQAATLYALIFAEGGNAWYEFNDFDPFNIKRSAGVGLRIFLPMIGLMGIDWGYGFDRLDRGDSESKRKGQFHFVLGQQF